MECERETESNREREDGKTSGKKESGGGVKPESVRGR